MPQAIQKHACCATSLLLATVVINFNVSILFLLWFFFKIRLSLSLFLSFSFTRCVFIHFLCGIRVCVCVHLCNKYTFNLFCITIILYITVLHSHPAVLHWKSSCKYACGIDHFQRVSYSVVIAIHNYQCFYSFFLNSLWLLLMLLVLTLKFHVVFYEFSYFHFTM